MLHRQSCDFGLCVVAHICITANRDNYQEIYIERTRACTNSIFKVHLVSIMLPRCLCTYSERGFLRTGPLLRTLRSGGLILYAIYAELHLYIQNAARYTSVYFGGGLSQNE
jgi:hypothetical protein